MKNRALLKQMAIDALFIALIAIFTYVPYTGYFTVGLISFTTIHIIVLLGAALFGYKRGLLYGFVFGLLSLIKAVGYPSIADYLFLNPFVSVLPRALFGLISGLVFDVLKKHTKPKTFNGLMFPLCGALTFLHTLLTLTCLYVFGVLDIFSISKYLGLSSIIEAINNGYSSLWGFIGGFLAIGSVFEIIIAIIVVPSIYLLVKSNYDINSVEKTNKS